MSNAITWLEPWIAVDDTDIGLEQQLRRELSNRHVLHGQSVHLIARRVDTDDALFQLADGRVAEVHLTWRDGVEPDPRWPATAMFSSLRDWAERSMEPLHRHWLERD